MKMFLYFIILFSVIANADDIYFKNGYMLKNVLVKDTTGVYISVLLSNDTRTYLLNTIDRIVKNEFDPSKQPIYGRIDDLKYKYDDIIQPEGLEDEKKLPAIAWDKNITVKDFDTYEEKRKNKSTAFLWSGIIPGGGMFYTGKLNEGLIMLGGDIVLGIFYFKADNFEKATPFVLLIIASRIFEYFKVSEYVDDYNRQLREDMFSPPLTNTFSIPLVTISLNL